MTTFLLLLQKIGKFLYAYKKYVLIVVGAVILIVLIFKACSGGAKPDIKFDENTLQQINSGIEQKHDAALEKVLVENGLIEQRIEERTAQSNQRLQAAEEKVKAAKAFSGDVTADELKRILEETQ
jgi:FtsZ-interacting cell division protein ZipA